MRKPRRILYVVGAVVAGLAASCDGTNDTIPSGWIGAQALTIHQSTCGGDGLGAAATVEVAETSDGVTGALEGVSVRCQQPLCAYVMDSGATTRVLVQPCDLHPTNVNKCACGVDVTFALPTRADRTAVEVYERADFYGAPTPPVPILLATKPVGPTARAP